MKGEVRWKGKCAKALQERDPVAEHRYRISYNNVQNRELYYCAFHKHANSQLRFPLPSIIITITSNES